MPRLKVNARADAGKDFCNAVRAAGCLKGLMTEADIARYIGMSGSTFNTRMKNPEKFTLGEVRQLTKLLKLNPEVITRMVGA